jgi:hypothetical protein
MPQDNRKWLIEQRFFIYILRIRGKGVGSKEWAVGSERG